MLARGYCPECGTRSDKVENRSYAMGITFWILECDECKTKWEIHVKR